MNGTIKNKISLKDKISVCICTYKRKQLLREALYGISKQIISESFTIEIVVVDNDKEKTAQPVIEMLNNEICHEIIYDCEPIKNIALARNRCILNSSGNYIVFIDDDEVPIPNWLILLYDEIKTTQSDGVLGPVLPKYPSRSPKWIKNGKIFNRQRFTTGTLLKNSRHTRTGNVLLSKELFSEEEIWFNPAYGLTGGEDVDFFNRKLALGYKFTWCNEAIVYESITGDRLTTNYHIRKYIRIGTISGERLSKIKISFSVILNFLKNLISIPIRLAILILSFPFGKHLWILPLLKLYYSVSFCMSFLGMPLIRNRE